MCGSGGFLYPCNEVPTQDRAPVPFGPFGLPVAPGITEDETPFAGPSEIVLDPQDTAEDVPVWDVTGFSEFLTEYKQKTAPSDGVEPRKTGRPVVWWILAALVALLIWKA